MESEPNTDICRAIGRGLSAGMAVERDLPDRLKNLLQQLRRADEQLARKASRDDR
jgi:hypothetical protein